MQSLSIGAALFVSVVVVGMVMGGCATGRGAPMAASSEVSAPCPPALVAARARLGAAGRAVVAAPILDLFERPVERPEDGAVRTPLADQALLGDLLTVLPPGACSLPSGRRVLVQTGASYRGYAEVSSLVPWPQPMAPYRTDTQVLRQVASRFANVYPQPDLTKSNPLLVLPLGVDVRQTQILSARWVQIVLPDGRPAFIQQGDLRPQEPQVSASSSATTSCVVEQALAHEGSPYLWGGRSTFGIDCSGLVASAYSACGVTVPRDARLQVAWDGLRPGPAPGPASIEGLLPGDLLFFSSGQAPTAPGLQDEDKVPLASRITHVGVYVGDGRFVHASTSERPTVHQSQLRDDEWQRRWVATRRYLPTPK